MIPLLIAAHGTRDADGEAQSRELVRLVAEQLAPIPVEAGFVELNQPPIADTLTGLLAAQDEDRRAVVVPLMLGLIGGHVREDIPEAIAEGSKDFVAPDVRYTRALGHDPRLISVVARRIRDAQGEWDRRDTTVILLGRGSAIGGANADHARLARILYETCEVAQVLPAFAQVTRPGLPEALNQAYALGARHIIVAPNLLFAGKLRTWMHEQVAAWCARRPDAEVRVAEVIGPCSELVDVVVDRYREAADQAVDGQGSPAYLAGLMLAGRDVLVVGAGHVADRRVPTLLAAGARVTVCSPTLSVRLRGLVRSGVVTWVEGPYRPGMVDGRWYVMACTNDPEVNAQVAAEAEEHRVFCVRADDARHGTSWTPATQQINGFTVGVLGNRAPRLSAAVRDAVVRELHG